MEVNTGEFEPHLNHVLRNSLIINVFNILHREITGKRIGKNFYHYVEMFTNQFNREKTDSSYYSVISFF